MRKHRPSGVGETWFFMRPIEELETKADLHCLDRLTDCRLHAPKPASGAGKAAGLSHCNKSPQMIEGKIIQQILSDHHLK